MPKKKNASKAERRDIDSLNETSPDPVSEFEVVTNPKRAELSPYVSDFDSRLNLKYAVLYNGEAGAWEQLKTYRAFQIAGSSIPVGSCIYVRGNENLQDQATTSDDQEEQLEYVKWAAQVLECRAPNARNVFLRVVWLYWPDDLMPYARRQNCHGETEVVPSNDMQIINALSVEGVVNVHRWTDAVSPNLSTQLVNSGDLIWRQTLDVHAPKTKTALLPKLPLHCICREPAKPEHYLIQCDHCQRWMHEECINSSAAEEASQDHPAGSRLLIHGDISDTPTSSRSGFAKFVDQVRSTIEKATSSSEGNLAVQAQDQDDEQPEADEKSKSTSTDAVDGKQRVLTKSNGQLSRPTKRKRANTKQSETPTHKRRFDIPEMEQSPNSKAATTNKSTFLAEVDGDYLAGLELVPALRITHTATGETWKVLIKCLFKDCGKIITSGEQQGVNVETK